MYTRFVSLKVKEGRFADLRRFYEDRVLPALEQTDGCLFASLLQPTEGSEDCLSVTLWSSQRRAEAYEESGLYDQLLDESDEFLAETTEWRVRLAGDRGGPVQKLQEPEVETYPVEIVAESDPVQDLTSSHLFVRIVAARIEPGRFAELKERYNNEVVPELLATPGCRAVFLVESMQARSRALSVTVWDREQDAIRYEMSGRFDDLTAKLSDLFSGLYQWKLSLAPAGDRDEVSGSDLDVTRYRVVTGRRIRG